MSYIPPHKRHSKNPVKPSPVPDSLVTKSNKNFDLKSSSSFYKDNAIFYSKKYIYKWFLVGSNGMKESVPSALQLVPVSSDTTEFQNGEKYMVLIKKDAEKANMITEESEEEERTGWMLLAEKIEEDLAVAYEQAKKPLANSYHVCNAKLRLVARFGKIVLSRRQAGPVAESELRNMYKTFLTDVPTSFAQNIKLKVVPSHEFYIDKEKETYIVKVTHHTRTDATISCKCTVKEDGRLRMHKVELNSLRHLVVDVSNIDENLDMRLMLAGKRKIVDLTDEERMSIQGLLDSATADPNVKGGLRWPLGKTSSKDGYSIFEVCHIRATTYKSGTLKLRIRETDRYNERSGTGEIKWGVTLILQEISTKLREQDIERGIVLKMLRDALGTIGDFLSCDASLK